MKKSRRESKAKYRTHTCSVGSVEETANRFAAKGWTLWDVILLADDRVLLIFENDTLDALGDMTQEQQIRLQDYLDIYTKIIEMLSNVLRKVSETQDSLISNIK